MAYKTRNTYYKAIILDLLPETNDICGLRPDRFQNVYFYKENFYPMGGHGVIIITHIVEDMQCQIN